MVLVALRALAFVSEGCKTPACTCVISLAALGRCSCLGLFVYSHTLALTSKPLNLLRTSTDTKASDGAHYVSLFLYTSRTSAIVD
jgi:hypothetical protein